MDNIDNNSKESLKIKAESLKTQYFKIHKAIFKYGLFIITIIFWLRKFVSVINSDYNINNIINHDLSTQKARLIENFSKKLSQIQDNKDITWYITLGDTKDDNETFQSYNNLIAYKWFIIPRIFRITKTTPLQALSYYASGNYSKDEMESFLKNMIISNNKTFDLRNKQQQLPITNSIIETFNINCIFQNKIYNKICSSTTENFINSFFIYNIDIDIHWFTTVFQELIKKEEFKKTLCTNLVNYSLYSNNTSENINRFIEYCWEKDKDKFQKFIYFSEIQKELESKYISPKVYNDDIINTYKLISFQQIIYNDLFNKRVNTERIIWYFNFLQEILKKNKISKFYKEEIYYFNNYYIQKPLENPEITSKITEKSDINDIYKQINIINNWSLLIWLKWLITQINPNIIINDVAVIDNQPEQDYEKILNLLLQQITNFSIQEKFFSGNNILVNGVMTLDNNNIQIWDNNKEKNIWLRLRLTEKERKLHIKQVELVWYKELTDIVNQLTQREDRVIVDLQKYINQNSSLIKEAWAIQGSSTEEICNNIKASLTWQNVQICDNNKISIDIIRKNKATTLNILHNNFILSKIDINNTGAKEILNQYLQQSEIQAKIQNNWINKDNISIFLTDLIYNLFNYKPKIIENNNYQWSTNTIIIIEKIKTYLGITVSDIIEKNWKILIEFTIKNINFIWNYNADTSTIQTIYFKDVTTNNLPMIIKNLSIIVDDKHQNTNNRFTNDPLWYIKQVSPDSYLFYQKFISESQK